VAEFTLPDGSVLKNAFVWKRSSEGLMIIHDDGQYFLNYKTLPPQWQAVYLGDEASTEEDKPEQEQEPVGDRYRIGSVLERAPDLATKTREMLLERGAGEEFDQGVLVIGLLQAILDENREDASRCILYLEEQDYEIEEVGRDKLFTTCFVCRGEGNVSRKCPACDGSGECSKCTEPDSVLGKRSSRDKQSMTSLGKRDSDDTDCEACEGSGDCPKCEGGGQIEVRCAKCRGAGKIVARIYCEVVRDKWVRKMNALVSGEPPATILASPSVDIVNLLGELPDINTNALTYYASASYDGTMDTNIVVACLMHTLVDKDLSTAKRFNLMLVVEYPDNEVIIIEEYLKLCVDCDAKGWCELDCSHCGGSGDCEKCEGDGDSMNLKNWEVKCSVCNSTGDCSACGGSGKSSGMCRTCMGLGRTFEKSRCEIRRELLVDDLTEYYQQNRPDPK
jgi:hypothetical protein